MRRFLQVLLSLALCACSVPMATPTSDAQGKLFEPPPVGEAALYVARTGIPNFDPAPITVGQRSVGHLTNSTWLRVDLPPGQYDVRATLKWWVGAGDVTLVAGEIRFVEVYPNVLSQNLAVHEMTAEEGRRVVLVGTRAREIR